MEGLPTTTKTERRSRSKNLHTSKPSLVMAFFSCVAWLYVAGRLWQDAENRKLLANLLKRNIEQKPKILTIEDKLMVLGCKDLERRIVEVEMDLTLAKSQGYLKHQLPQSESSSQRKLLAVIGVYTGFGSYLKRNTFRGSWMPRGGALKKLEERGVVIRFVIGRSANRGDSLDRHIDEENSKTKDFFILEGHEEAQEELPKKIKFFFSTAVQNWDAEFYIKVDDNIDVDLEGLIGLLEHRRRQGSAYIGCMKSGEVVSEEGKLWYEPEWWKFGDEKSIQADVYLLKKKRDDVVDDIGCTSCSSTCSEDCVCRVQCISCSKACRCPESCTNRPFSKEKKTRIVKTELCGWGVEATEPIKKGDFVIEYIGEAQDPKGEASNKGKSKVIE